MDSGHQTRQYGIVDAFGRTATFSGTRNGKYASGLVGHEGSLSYAIQGNVITGQPVLDKAEEALLKTKGDLAARLLAAMEAAARGVKVQIFGLSTDNARAFWNWNFIPGERPDLPQTRAMLMRACDVRLPARLQMSDLDYIADALIAAAEDVNGVALLLVSLCGRR